MGSEESKHLVDVVEYTDPYCTWCWGAEPVLRKIKELYGNQVEISFKMGGLVKDIRRFYDPLNKIGGTGLFEQVAEHWAEASRRHGMPVDAGAWKELAGDFTSQLCPDLLPVGEGISGESRSGRGLFLDSTGGEG